MGKLEWGFATTGDEISAHGWDYHYGYYDHEMCHGYYPPFLFENGEMIFIEGNTHIDCGKGVKPDDPEYEKKFFDREGRKVYCQDLFDKKIIEFINKHRNQPFFLYHPSTLPHGVLAVTELHPDVKDNCRLTFREKIYASMVLRLDKTVGMILDELNRTGLSDNTMIIFSSDNGHQHTYYTKFRNTFTEDQKKHASMVDDINTKLNTKLTGDIFNGNDGMAGYKGSNWEGRSGN